VRQQQREISVRMALGAGRAQVLRLVLSQGMLLVGTGVLIGIALSLLSGRALSRVLYDVSACDPVSLTGASLVLLTVAGLACYLPARAASRVDPLRGLRAG
jgi:ABC-type antimicrobial peptide transport system permease subunit